MNRSLPGPSKGSKFFSWVASNREGGFATLSWNATCSLSGFVAQWPRDEFG
jgi:hypothetical protein